jgi:Flp pilus assembly protein TadG
MTAKTFLRCIRGGAAIEFAIVAPVFLGLLMGVMEYCRVIWTVQTLNSVAFSTARCATYSTTCNSTSTIQTYAVQQAQGFGLSVSASGVVYATNTTCNGNSAQNKVTVSYTLNSPLAGFAPAFPATVTGTGCFNT